MKYLPTIAMTAALSLLSSGAFAETTWDVLQRFGLVGTWAYPCSQPPSTTNWWVTYFKDPVGLAKRSADRGPGVPKLMVAIDSAQILSSTTMAVRSRDDDPNWGQSNGTVFDVVLVKENGRVRSLSARTSTGQEFIKNGIVVASNAPAPWLEKCSK
jgi:hypothetical protein